MGCCLLTRPCRWRCHRDFAPVVAGDRSSLWVMMHYIRSVIADRWVRIKIRSCSSLGIRTDHWCDYRIMSNRPSQRYSYTWKIISIFATKKTSQMGTNLAKPLPEKLKINRIAESQKFQKHFLYHGIFIALIIDVNILFLWCYLICGLALSM